MDKYDIELFAAFFVDGRMRPAGWKGTTTSGYAKLIQRAGAGKVTKAAPAPPEEPKKGRAK